jgi:enoyl-CoA hydratase
VTVFNGGRIIVTDRADQPLDQIGQIAKIAQDMRNAGCMSEAGLVLSERRGRVGLLTVNRPEKRNALNSALRQAIQTALQNAWNSSETRVVVITGAGDKAFIAGADIAEFEGRTPVDQYRVMSEPGIYDAIERSPKPIVAAINGFCLGGGMELALACDIRVASSTAKFGQPEVGLGILPGGGGTQRLPRVVGLGAALRLILSGERIDGCASGRLEVLKVASQRGALRVAHGCRGRWRFGAV